LDGNEFETMSKQILLALAVLFLASYFVAAQKAVSELG
jgi:hypothetical protein